MKKSDHLYDQIIAIAKMQETPDNEANVLDWALAAAMKHLSDNPQALKEVALAVHEASDPLDSLKISKKTKADFEDFIEPVYY